MKSKFLNLNFKDLAKGLLTAVIVAVITYLYEVIGTGDFTTIDWKVVGTTALIAAVGYLFKNLVTNSEGTPFKTEAAVTKKNSPNY